MNISVSGNQGAGHQEIRIPEKNKVNLIFW